MWVVREDAFCDFLGLVGGGGKIQGFFPIDFAQGQNDG